MCSLEHGRFFFPFAKLKASAGPKGLQSCSHVRTRSLCLPAKGCNTWMDPLGADLFPREPWGFPPRGFVAAIHWHRFCWENPWSHHSERGVMRKLTVRCEQSLLGGFEAFFWKVYPDAWGDDLIWGLLFSYGLVHRSCFYLKPYKPCETPLPCQQCARHSRSLKEVLAHTLSSPLSFPLPTLGMFMLVVVQWTCNLMNLKPLTYLILGFLTIKPVAECHPSTGSTYRYFVYGMVDGRNPKHPHGMVLKPCK